MATVNGFVADVARLDLPGGADEAIGIYLPGEGTGAPERRNYSVRLRGPDPAQVTCDVVLHERGAFSDWARRVKAGDRVALDHARSWYRPEPTTHWQLLVADLSGLPALPRILDELPGTAAAAVIVEGADEADLRYLPGYEKALADGKGDKVAAEEFDRALESVGL